MCRLPSTRDAETPCLGTVQVQHRYFLLVIMTTSTGADLEQFQAALTGAAGELALSVIVVGVGDTGFGPLRVCSRAASVILLWARLSRHKA